VLGQGQTKMAQNKAVIFNLSKFNSSVASGNRDELKSFWKQIAKRWIDTKKESQNVQVNFCKLPADITGLGFLDIVDTFIDGGGLGWILWKDSDLEKTMPVNLYNWADKIFSPDTDINGLGLVRLFVAFSLLDVNLRDDTNSIGYHPLSYYNKRWNNAYQLLEKQKHSMFIILLRRSLQQWCQLIGMDYVEDESNSDSDSDSGDDEINAHQQVDVTNGEYNEEEILGTEVDFASLAL